MGKRTAAAWERLRGRMTKGLMAASLISMAMIIALNAIPAFIGLEDSTKDAYAIISMIISTLATSVFAACVVSFMFDIKSIRDLIVKNDADLLLKMLLNSNELFSIDGCNGSEHKKILKDLRLKATAALNGIRLDDDAPSESSAEMREGHVQACLTALDDELDKAYAKYVNISRDITNEGNGVFHIDEKTYVRYMNDTETPKEIRAWNFLRSAMLPDDFSNPLRNTLNERVSITINEGIPEVYCYKQECEIVGIQGIDTTSRRWKCQWEEELRRICVPAHGTCVVEMERSFYIPEKEEISYRWETVRSKCSYKVTYHGTDCMPIMHILNCRQCKDVDSDECQVCNNRDDRRIIPKENSTMAILKNWPNTETTIKITWV